MAEFDNLSSMNENFDTIKTLLNSIRAQGVLNTSDVDKLLTGIHSKLEKINTEEDIDLIKIFLSELKQNLDERHNILVSKFGAIESLFTNLLKNSTEMPKSSELKELFDIVATNLSVFSREVVSQKEALTDITLRLDAIRTDDTLKKDVVKNISLLRPDLEKLNNGFDSIVVNLNENFKSVIKSISTIDQTERLDKFSSSILDMEMSFNTILSALQMLDKKTSQVEDVMQNLSTKEEVGAIKQKLFEIAANGHELNTTVTDLSDRYLRIDNLAEKIDASVSIVAGLKSFLEQSESTLSKTLLDEISKLEYSVQQVATEAGFEQFKASLENAIKNIFDNIDTLNRKNNDLVDELKKVANFANSLNINTGFETILNSLAKSENSIKTNIEENNQKILTLQDANITRVLNDITQNSEILSSKLNQTQSEIAMLCEKNFGSVFTTIADLKNIVSQIDENSVSANNAIFSSITDRLTVFENSLKVALDTQESTLSKSTTSLVEQVDNIRKISDVLDYKLDTSVVEVGNVKRSFEEIKSSLDDIIALDFANAVKDLRVDLYASKQELKDSIENVNSELSNQFTNDIYGKYELLIAKLDNVEDEFKKTQTASLNNLKAVLENISSSIVDIISYVSEKNPEENINYEAKLDNLSAEIKETNISYVENVRDIVNFVKTQIEEDLKTIDETSQFNFDVVKKHVSENSDAIKKELQYSYSKLLEIQDAHKELKEIINVNRLSDTNKIQEIIAEANNVKNDFELKLNNFKSLLLESISNFKQEFTIENADKISELKFSVESLHSRNFEDITDLINEIKTTMARATNEEAGLRAESFDKIINNINAIKDYIVSANTENSTILSDKVNLILNDFNQIKDKLASVDNTIDEDFTRQLSIIESNFEALISQISILFEKNEQSFSERITKEFDLISEQMHENMLENLELYKVSIEKTVSSLDDSTLKQSQFIQNKVVELNDSLQNILEAQTQTTSSNIENFTNELKQILDDESQLTNSYYKSLQEKLSEINDEVKEDSLLLAQELKSQINEISSNIQTTLVTFEENNNLKTEETFNKLDEVSEKIELTLSLSDEKNSVMNDETIKNINNVSDNIEKAFSSSEEKHLYRYNETLKKINEVTETINVLLGEKNSADEISFNKTEELLNNISNNITDSSDSIKNFVVNQTISLPKIQKEIELTNQSVNENLNKVDKIETILNQQEINLNSNFTNIEQLISNSDAKIETVEFVNNKHLELAKYQSENIATLLTLLNEQLNLSKDINTEINSIEDLSNKIIAKNDILEISQNEQLEIAKEQSSKIETLDLLLNKQTELSQNIKLELEKLTSGHVDFNYKIDNLEEIIRSQTELIKNSELQLKLIETQSINIEEKVLNISDLIESQIEFRNKVLEQIQIIAESNNEHSLLIQNDFEAVLNQLSTISNELSNLKDTSNVNLLEINSKTDDVLNYTKIITDSTELTNSTLKNILESSEKNLTSINNIETVIQQNSSDIQNVITEASTKELQRIESYINNIFHQIEAEKQSVRACNELVEELLKKELEAITSTVEKETDIIVGELIEQFDILKKSQSDDIISLTNGVDEIIENRILEGLEDLKGYLDIKTDNSVISCKIDNLKNEMTESTSLVLANMNKLLDADAFYSSTSDFKTTIEILITTTIENLNSKLSNFVETYSNNFSTISENNKLFDEKLTLFDKKIVDIIIEKYEEIKLLSNEQNSSIKEIKSSIEEVLKEFAEVKYDVDSHINALIETLKETNSTTNAEIRRLADSFENLRSQISNKSFDEAFQASINKQIASLESLIVKQLGHIEDISDLCANSLPDVSELNVIVKHSVLTSLDSLNEKVQSLNFAEELEKELKETKSDIITQLINIFNQISFETEQEEILDFIQTKHDELISILSHIVTSSQNLDDIKAVTEDIDYKVEDIKDEICQINKKINSIISSENDVDYIYSLHDLESDIANLRYVLSEIQKTNSNSKEFSDLLNSTNEIYNLVETIKSEIPSKMDFDEVAENIVSISTRTNKLLLATDESYKTLQDNLQEFKLVVNDLDERTRNFAQDSGLDKIDNKLNSINQMMKNGAKSNQVFNQVFEYLAQWVDNAGTQIDSITNKIESLDEIGQIKSMLQDLKSNSEDSVDSMELVDALGKVFDKQNKRISSLETKLDKIIVETINNNSHDMTTIEATLNKFLVAMDDKFSSQQRKITALETKLIDVMSLLETNDNTQLTKKVGGMDKQIAKLNKSIEKIASHVVEK